MDNEFEVIEKVIGPAIEIEERILLWHMPATFSRDYKRIAEYLESQGADCIGMPYARYLDMDWDVELNRGKLATFFSLLTKKWHFFAGMPSSKTLAGSGDLKTIVHTSQRYARGVHRGPYRKCDATYKALIQWAKDKGVTLKNEAIECYVNDPNEVDESDIETIILIPLES